MWGRGIGPHVLAKKAHTFQDHPLGFSHIGGTLGLGCGGVNRKSTRKMSLRSEILYYCCEKLKFRAIFSKCRQKICVQGGRLGPDTPFAFMSVV
jgi:hypothetical protein